MNNSEPVKRRLHWVASAVAGFRSLAQLVPVLVVAALSGRGDDGQVWPLAIAVGLLPLSLTLGFIQWWRYRYWVENGELRVEHGLFIRRRVFLPRERIQAIDVSAGVVQRIFGLVRVQIKCAAAGCQAELSAVTRTEAERLRADLGQTVDGAGVLPSANLPASYKITPGQLLLAASTSGQIGVVLSGVAWVYAQVDEIVQEQLIAWIENEKLAGAAPNTSPLLIFFVVLGSLILAWLLSILGAVVRYGGFTVERRGDELIVRRGLLERREVSISLDRVQAIRIVESPSRQPFGYAALYVESAGHAEARGKSTYLHPCLHRGQWLTLIRDLLPEFAVEPQLHRPPNRAIIRFLFRPVLVATVLAATAAVFFPFGWLAFGLPVVTSGVALLSYRDTGLGVTDRVAVVRSRWLNRRTAVVPRRRIQFVNTATSWLQRRRRVADVAIGAAAGASGRRFEARELDENVAASFLSWCSSAVAPTPGNPEAIG